MTDSTISNPSTQQLKNDSNDLSLLPLPNGSPPNKIALLYDIIMLIIIVIDLVIIGVDLVLMSTFAAQLSEWLGVSQYYQIYTEQLHHPLRVLGGFFTIFLISELLIRWIVSVVTKQYSRWFFFPFAHWYEVLGCIPQLRALRLLRAFFIGRKLYQLGYQVLPERWIETGKFYYGVVFEELSDRVILTATDNLRQQFADEQANQRFIEETLNKNRAQISTALTSILQQELAPKLRLLANTEVSNSLSKEVGHSIQNALDNTPELRRYLRLIPIAGGLIESQLQTIVQSIAENLTANLLSNLTQAQFTDALIEQISETVAHLDLSNPELDALVSNIVNDGLTAFEQQVKVQQWKHHDYLRL